MTLITIRQVPFGEGLGYDYMSEADWKMIRGITKENWVAFKLWITLNKDVEVVRLTMGCNSFEEFDRNSTEYFSELDVFRDFIFEFFKTIDINVVFI